MRRERYETASIYWKKSERLYNDLKNNYADILPLFNEGDLTRNLNSAQAFAKEYYGACYDPSGELTNAKCCAKKRPIANKYLKEHNEFVKERAARAMSVWKSYIDGLINVILLDPSARNKRFVDQHLVLYFSMLAQVAGAVSFENPVECESINLSDEELDALIKSSRAINFQCPSWLNIEFDLQVAKLKADCEKFEVEAGKGFIGAFEKNFKTGSSTISAGVGASQNFVAGKAKLKQMVYVTFDNDNQFSDMGVKGTVEISVSTDPVQIAEGITKVAGKIAGVEGGYTWGVNSGFQTSVKGKGIISDLKITHKF